jgi:hypothetical protein
MERKFLFALLGRGLRVEIAGHTAKTVRDPMV